MRTLLVLCLASCCWLGVGCGCLPPFKTEAEMSMSLRTPVHAQINANMNTNTVTDHGPLQEIPVIPGTCPCPGQEKVVVIDVDGLLLNMNKVGPFSLGENPVSTLQEKLTVAAMDPSVKAVVLRINSSGGSVAATELMWRTLIDFRQGSGKPVVASIQDMGTGGAYYLASACNEVFAIPGAVIGGIGVMLNLYYLQLTMEQWNAFDRSIKAGEHVDMGSPVRDKTEEENKMLTAMAREYHNSFKQMVLHCRPRVQPDSPAFDGRVMTTTAAAAAGLIDGVCFLPEAIEKARQLANAGPVHVVMYCRPANPSRSIYDVSMNRPVQAMAVPVSVPGLDRSKLPLFLYIWDVDPTLVKVQAQ